MPGRPRRRPGFLDEDVVVEQPDLRGAGERCRRWRRAATRDHRALELRDPLPVAEVLEEGAGRTGLLGADRQLARRGQVALDPGGQQLDLVRARGRREGRPLRRGGSALRVREADRFVVQARAPAAGSSRPSHPRRSPRCRGGSRGRPGSPASPPRPPAAGRRPGSRTRAAPSTRDRSAPSAGRPRRSSSSLSRTKIRRVHLPVLVEAAEVVAGLGADHQLPVESRRTTYSASPSGSTIGSSQATRSCRTRDPLVEPVRVLVAGLDVLHLAPREPLVEQRLERLALERLAGRERAARPLATSEAARNSAADSSGVSLPGSRDQVGRQGRRRDVEAEVLGQVPEAAELRRPAR